MRITIIVSTLFLVVASAMIPCTAFAQENQNTPVDAADQYVPQVIIEAKWGNSPREFGFIDGNGNEPSRGPTAIAIDDDNNIYALDSVNRRILKYDRDGKYFETINLEQKQIKIKTTNPTYLLARKNPKAIEDMYGKDFLKEQKEYVETEIEAINFLGLFQEIKIDRKRNIYHRTGLPQHPQCYALVVYDKAGRILRAYTKEQIGENTICGLDVDNKGRLYFLIAGKTAPRHAFEINQDGEIRKYEWAKLGEKFKAEKFGNSLRKRKEIQNFATLPQKLTDVIKRNRRWYKTHETSGYDANGNVYEIVWDEKNFGEGVKVIKWKKTR